MSAIMDLITELLGGKFSLDAYDGIITAAVGLVEDILGFFK